MSREEARLATIRSLSQQALKLLAPDQESGFARDFGLWAATAARLSVQEHPRGKELIIPVGPKTVPGREKAPLAGAFRGLDTTLVAGMFFQVILEAEHLPGNSLERTTFVKQAVKNFLVQRLAGQITLSQFFRLVQIIEHEVTYYFHRLQGQWVSPDEIAGSMPPSHGGNDGAAAPGPSIRIADLRSALTVLALPHQSNRKLSPEGLFDFLVQSDGRWFRLMDFESHFCLNKKTAWTYLTLLLKHDILRHNEEKANKVRYALSHKFMALPAEPLR